ncbi:MAG: PKD domain-containing protein [Chitinophagales bacterium]|nr:PKD domain-containing protein [Chitinophagales bacterium]
MTCVCRSFFLFLGFLLFDGKLLLAQCPIQVDAGDDIYLCAPPTPTQLNGSISGDFLNFFWSPTAGLSGSNTLSPTANVTTTTTYTLTGRAADYSNNLITNGDFEAGASSFDSDYNYSPGDLWLEGTYDVIPSPAISHPNFAPCQDHTSGGGNMLVINGAGVPNQNVWCQTISVDPNKQYVFSAWICSVISSSPAQLQFSINGTTIGPIFTPGATTCAWQNFFAIWNSGASTTATICIVNQNTATSGNDFAIDDIVFAPTCLVSDQVTINVINVVAQAAPTFVTIPCSGATVTLNGTGSSTGPGITYSWDTGGGNIVSGENTLNPVVNEPGTYTLTVSFTAPDGTICEKTATVQVTLAPNQLLAWINPPPPLGCGFPTITLVGNTNQTAFAQYQWTTPDGNIVSGENNKNCVINEPGEYNLLVTNTQTGCTAEAFVTVTEANNPPTANATAGGSITCTQTTAPLSGTGSTTGSTINYSWTTLGGSFSGPTNMINATAASGGLYILAVTNTVGGCVAFDTVLVTANIAPPTITMPDTLRLNCVVDTVSISASLNPANATFAWTATQGGAFIGATDVLTVSSNTPGVYTLVATRPSNGCTVKDSTVVITDYTPPIAAIATPDSLTCQAPSISLSGAGSSVGPKFHYLWTAGPGANIVSGDTTLTPVVNAQGTYTLQVTNSQNGCTASASVFVKAGANVVLAVANTPGQLDCNTAQLNLNANGSSTGVNIRYNWSTADGHIAIGANTATPLIDKAGTYVLTVTNQSNGCTATDVAQVVKDTLAPALTFGNLQPLTCLSPQRSILVGNLSLPGNFSYNWAATAGGNIVSGQGTPEIIADMAGNYRVTVSNLDNGCSNTADFVLTSIISNPLAVIAPPDVLTCADPTEELIITGSTSGNEINYTWSFTLGGNIVSGTLSGGIIVNAPADYIITITNETNGCTATASTTVLSNQINPPAEAGAGGEITCAVAQYPLNANAGQANTGLSFSWSTIDGFISGNANQANVVASMPGMYYLNVTNTNSGCSSTDSVLIGQNLLAPDFSINIPDTITCTVSSVSLSAIASATGLQYAWATSGGSIIGNNNTANLSAGAAGTYTVTVTDPANGCSNVAAVQVAEDKQAPILSISTAQDLTCIRTTLNLNAQNALSGNNFSYLWSEGVGATIVSGKDGLQPLISTPGQYMLLATNTDNGCTATATTTVMQNITPPTVDAGTGGLLTCTAQSLSLSGTASAQGTLSMEWSKQGTSAGIISGINTLQPIVGQPGWYTLSVTDQLNGCKAVDSVEVNSNIVLPPAAVSVNGILTCTITTLQLQGSTASGPEYSFSWTAPPTGMISANGNTLTPTIDGPGTYLLSVSNNTTGCTNTASVAVQENITPPVADAGADKTLNCQITQTPLNGNASVMPAQFAWTAAAGGQIIGNANSANITAGAAGTYRLIVTNPQNGCTDEDEVQVAIDTIAPAGSISAPAPLTCKTLQLSLQAQVTQPANAIAQWSSSNGFIVSGANTLTPLVNRAGIYQLLLRNPQNGCTRTLQTSVSQDTAAPIVVINPADSITCTTTQVSLNATGSSSGAAFQNIWSGPQILSGGQGLSPNVGASGVYTLQITNNTNGCSATASVNVPNSTQIPLALIATPATLTCTTQQVTIPAGASSSGPTIIYQWSSSNGTGFVSGQTSNTPVVNAPGQYTLLVRNQQNGCTATATVSVNQNISAPGANAGPDRRLFCDSLQTVLNGSSPAGNGMQYAWTALPGGHLLGNTNVANASADEAGVYRLVVSNPANGCSSSDEVVVSEIPPPVFEPTLWQPDCFEPRGALDFGSISGGLAPFKYSVNGGSAFSNDPAFENLATGKYTLVVRDALGCEAEKEIEILPPFFPKVELPEYLVVNLGDDTTITPQLNLPVQNVVKWDWSPADYLSCNDCPEPVTTPLNLVIYTLTITDKNGCTASDKVQLRVTKKRFIYVPNIFKPEDAGENSHFTIYAKGVLEIKHLRVYDRWGSMVFENRNFQPNNPQIGWDGRDRGKAVSPGVFVWEAAVVFPDGAVEILSGDVTILR